MSNSTVPPSPAEATLEAAAALYDAATPVAPRPRDGIAPYSGVCARTGRPYRAGDFVEYVPGLGIVLPEHPRPGLDAAGAPLDPAAILAAFGFGDPAHLRDLQTMVGGLQRLNPERLLAMGRIMGEFLVHGTTHYTTPPAP